MLEKDGHEICFAGVFGALRERIKDKGYRFEELSARGLCAESLKSVLFSSFFMLKSIITSFKILRNIRPDAVLGFGGYAAFPVILTAALLKYPTMIHEQNVLPGRANAILAKIVKKIAISFEESKKYFDPVRTVLTGYPCREVPVTGNYDKAQLLREFHLENNKFTILIMGGSQGSRRINSVFLTMIPMLKGSLDFQVIHIAGKEDRPLLDKIYLKERIPYRVFSFLEDMDKAYEIADLVVSRAGAGSVCEIAAFSLPAILIPYPYAGGHQKENAAVLVKTHTAQIIEERNLSPDTLKESILSFVNQRADRENIKKLNQEIYHPRAAEHLAKEAVGIGRVA